MGFKEAASAYLDHSERKHAKSTYKYKKVIIKTFLEMHGDIPVTDIDPIHITNYLTSLKTNAVYNARRKDLSACFSWIIKTYKLSMENPCNQVDKMPVTPKTKTLPSDDEVVKLILAAKPGDEQDIIMCCIHLLGRIDEILRMTWQDTNFEKKVVTLWTRKRRGGSLEPDDMPMNEDLHEILYSRYKSRKNEKWVFYNEKAKEGQGDRFYHRPKMMASLCKRAKIDPIGQSQRKVDRGKNKGKYVKHDLYYGFHVLRHFTASHLADKEKIPMKALSKLLRHTSLKTTEIYVHSIDESVRHATVQMEGKFTPKNTIPRPEAAPIKEKEPTVNG